MIQYASIMSSPETTTIENRKKLRDAAKGYLIEQGHNEESISLEMIREVEQKIVAANSLIQEGKKPNEITQDMLNERIEKIASMEANETSLTKRGGTALVNKRILPEFKDIPVNFFNFFVTGTYHPPVQSMAELTSREQMYKLRLAQLETEQQYLRQAVELKFRNMVAIPITAVVGLVDGTAEAAAIALAELIETTSFAAARTWVRLGEGWNRGMNSKKP